MVKFILVKVSRLERWKRFLARGETKRVWKEIESFRASGGDSND